MNQEEENFIIVLVLSIHAGYATEKKPFEAWFKRKKKNSDKSIKTKKEKIFQ